MRRFTLTLRRPCKQKRRSSCRNAHTHFRLSCRCLCAPLPPAVFRAPPAQNKSAAAHAATHILTSASHAFAFAHRYRRLSSARRPRKQKRRSSCRNAHTRFHLSRLCAPLPPAVFRAPPAQNKSAAARAATLRSPTRFWHCVRRRAPRLQPIRPMPPARMPIAPHAPMVGAAPPSHTAPCAHAHPRHPANPDRRAHRHTSVIEFMLPQSTHVCEHIEVILRLSKACHFNKQFSFFVRSLFRRKRFISRVNHVIIVLI